MSPDKRHKIAFDWDGTLVDCRARQTAVLASVWKDLGAIAILDLDSWWKLKREGMSTLKALLKLGVTEENARKAASQWQSEIEKPEWLACDAVFPDALAAVKKVIANGYSAVVVTARTIPGNVRDQIAKSNLAALISDIFVVEPASASEQKSAVLMREKPEAFIGDSETDFQSAQRAGILFAGVTGGQRSRAYLKSAGANPLYDNVSDATDHILARLGKISPG